MHNLGRIDPQPTRRAAFDWAQRFDDDAAEIMTSAPGARAQPARTRRLRAAPRRHPTTSSRCSTSPVSRRRPARRADVLVDGYAMGSLSMTSYTLGCHDIDTHGRARRAAPARRPCRRDQPLTRGRGYSWRCYAASTPPRLCEPVHAARRHVRRSPSNRRSSTRSRRLPVVGASCQRSARVPSRYHSTIAGCT